MAAPTAPGGSEGLSLQTLLVASLASAGAALITSLFWQQGTIMAAALTPVLVALLREALHRPAERLSSVRSVRRPRAAAAGVRAGSAGGVAGAGAAGTTATGPTAAGTRPEGTKAPTAKGTHGRPETEPLTTSPAPAEPETRAVEGKTEPLPSGGTAAGDEATRRLDPEALTEGPPPPLPTRVADPGGEPTKPTEPLGDRLGRRPGAAGAGVAGAGAAGAAGGAAGAASGGLAGTRGRDRLQPDRGAGPPRPDRAPARPAYSRYSAARARAVRGLTPRRVRVALVTGLLAFLIAAVAITVPELITGESIGGGGEGGTTLFPGERASDSGSSGGIEDSPIDEDQGEPSGGDSGGGTAPDSGGGPGDSGGSQPNQGSGSSEPPASQSQGGSEARRSSPAPSQSSGGGSGGRP